MNTLIDLSSLAIQDMNSKTMRHSKDMCHDTEHVGLKRHRHVLFLGLCQYTVYAVLRCQPHSQRFLCSSTDNRPNN